jgi:hypothetical protein
VFIGFAPPIAADLFGATTSSGGTVEKFSLPPDAPITNFTVSLSGERLAFHRHRLM